MTKYKEFDGNIWEESGEGGLGEGFFRTKQEAAKDAIKKYSNMISQTENGIAKERIRYKIWCLEYHVER